MKSLFKKSLSLFLVFIMCVSVLFGLNLSIFAADTNSVTYVYDGNYIYNWGTRGTTATFLSPNAEAFYTKNNVTLSGFLTLDGSSSESGIPSSALYQELQQLMTVNHSYVISYDNTRPLFMYTDCQNNGTPNTISSFYSGIAIGPEWDGGSTWNREHTWPNSKGDLAGNGENDIMMLRPAATSENGSRGNKAYGSSTDTIYFYPNLGSYDLRGDVARIILYQYVRWGCTNTGSSYNATSIFGADGVIESQDLLLTWIEQDPVDTWEMGRNDSVEAITGTRNVFVDYPELAFDLFNESVPTGYTTPSGGADVEGSTNNSSLTKATITFDDTSKRTAFSTSSQVWEENGITFTNNKSSSTSAVGDYSNPIRIYKNSEVIISYPTPITKIEFATTGSTYSTPLETSLADYGSVSTSNNVVTLALATPTKTFTFSNTGGATRFNSITIYAETSSGDSGDSGETTDPEEPTDPTPDPDDTTQTVEVNATIDFTTTNQRVSQTTTQQIWTNDGLTFTNDKASSGTNVANYSNPIRIYANSTITIDYPNMHKIVIDATSVGGTKYATPWVTSFGTFDGTATIDSSNAIITITFNNPVDTFTITASAQIRAKTLTTYATQTVSGGGDNTEATITAHSNNDAYGTVEVSSKYITATPAIGYEIDSTNPFTIISGTATVTQSGNSFTVEADADVTIQINFIARTQYTVTFSDLGVTSTVNVYNGDIVTLPTLTSTDYTAVGWVVAEIDGETTDKPTVYNAGSAYTVTANTTLYALYSRTQAGGSGESDTFAKYTGAITEGDYLIVYSGYAMQAGVSSNRFTQSAVTDNGGSITSPDAALIWTVTADGSYFTLYNESTAKFAAGTGTKNQGKLLDSVTDYARWTVSGTATYEFVNKGNAAKSVNSNLRRNGTYGFACYATGTGGALTLYKRTAAAMTTYYFTTAGQQVTYTITANANNDEYGSVNVSGTTILATPADGYTVLGYTITSGTATVTQEGTTFFVTPTSDVEITINFEALPTYTVTFIENGEEVDTKSTYSGGFITLPTHTGELDEYTTFNGWAAQENETDTAKIFAAGSKYAVTDNVTLYAQYTVEIIETSDHNFVKITENLDDWTGTYLIVYEAGNKALNGAISDKVDTAGNNVDVQIVNNKIAALDANLAATVVIEKIDGGYTMRTNSGLYFGSESNSNSLLSNATKTYVNTISIDTDGNAVITGEGGAIFRYNITSGQDRFRFYKTDSYSNQQPIALYKLDIGEISGAQVTIGADLTMKYYVDLLNADAIDTTDLIMKFSIDGEIIDTVNGVKDNDTFVFDFVGLAPQRMADIIVAEVFYKNNLIDVKDDYSIKQNIINLLADNPSEALVQFVTDMLYYGAAAQKYTQYNTDNLATDGVVGLSTPSNKVPTDTDFQLNKTTGNAGFRSATVWFDSVNRLVVKVNNPNSDNIKVYVTPQGGVKTELVYNSDVGGYVTDGIKVTEFNKTHTFELCDESDNVIQTLKYSINAYAYSKQNSTNPKMVDLALALFRLGLSALGF